MPDKYTWTANNITALEPEWRHQHPAYGLLASIPTKNTEYNISLEGPISIDLQNNFWCIYMNPNSYLNGMETEEDIKSIHFCLVKAHDVVEEGKHLLIKVMVEEIKALGTISINKNPKVSQISLFEKLDGISATTGAVHTQQFKEYSIIDINFQGNLGITLIIKNQTSKMEIIAINEWNFNFNRWFPYKRELTQPGKEAYNLT